MVHALLLPLMVMLNTGCDTRRTALCTLPEGKQFENVQGFRGVYGVYASMAKPALWRKPLFGFTDKIGQMLVNPKY